MPAQKGKDLLVKIDDGAQGFVTVAGAGILVTKVHDVKATRANEKGPGQGFIMVDAGFNDLVRPAMYGSATTGMQRTRPRRLRATSASRSV